MSKSNVSPVVLLSLPDEEMPTTLSVIAVRGRGDTEIHSYIRLADLSPRVREEVEGDLRKLGVLEVLRLEDDGPHTLKITHGANLFAENIVAVIGGTLCPEKACDWCDDLRRRCQSRRLA